MFKRKNLVTVAVLVLITALVIYLTNFKVNIGFSFGRIKTESYQQTLIGDCFDGKCNCKDVDTVEAVDVLLSVLPGDPNGFDGDNNGVGCTSANLKSLCEQDPNGQGCTFYLQFLKDRREFQQKYANFPQSQSKDGDQSTSSLPTNK